MEKVEYFQTEFFDERQKLWVKNGTFSTLQKAKEFVAEYADAPWRICHIALTVVCSSSETT